MQTPPDIPEAVKMMRELGIAEMTISNAEAMNHSGHITPLSSTVTLKLGPPPPIPGTPHERPKNPLQVLARGSRLQLRRTEADATKASPPETSDGSTSR